MRGRLQKSTTLRLSRRLQTIVDHLQAPYPVWDLCCDHGLVGQKAFSMKRFESIHFVDQVDHIIRWLRQDFLDRFSLNEIPPNVAFTEGDVRGISFPLREANIVMGGVGAFLMNQVIEQLTPGAHLRLILAPNKNASQVKERALKKGFILTQEISVVEDGRDRVVFIFDSPPFH